MLVIWYFALNCFNNNGTYRICLIGSSCNMTVTGQHWLARAVMAIRGRWHSSTTNILFKSLESITLATSLSLCLSIIRGALSKWGSQLDFHLTSTQPIMEVNYVSSAVDRMDLPWPPLGLTGLCLTTVPHHKDRNVSQFMWRKCQLTSSLLFFWALDNDEILELSE